MVERIAKHPENEILSALDEERRLTHQPFAFVVAEVVNLSNCVRVTVEPQDARSRLDESLEGQTAWWVSPRNGFANVMAVMADYSKIDLRFVSAPLPPPGNAIFIAQPDFLGDLIDLWENEELAGRALARFESDPSPWEEDGVIDHDGVLFPNLRARQRECLRLPSYRGLFLWGPPGTGKTTTVGCLAAAYLLNQPQSKVLLMSTTNTAADRAIVAVDRALEYLSIRMPAAADLRHPCRRIGLHFIPDHFKGREHLLPVQDPELIRVLADLESHRPDAEVDSVAYEEWRDKVDALRAEIRKQLLNDIIGTKLHAMTATYGTFDFEQLDELDYDLVVFDEASQLSLVHGLMLSTLGKRVLFAGDPKQLAPIVQSELAVAEKWLGRSMFELMRGDGRNTIMLDEQNRMCEPICNIVSSMFYQKKLKVAIRSKNNPDWLSARRLPDLPGLGEYSGEFCRVFRGKVATSTVVRTSLFLIIAGWQNCRQ